MEAPAKGAVVLVRFPFSDLSQTRDLITAEIGVLTDRALTQIVDAVVALLRSGAVGASSR